MHHVAHLLVSDARADITHDVIDQFVEDAYYQEYSIAQVCLKTTSFLRNISVSSMKLHEAHS